MCVNGKEDSKLKLMIKYSPTYLGDSLCFTVAISAYFNLWMSVADVENCFQNTLCSLEDKIFMLLLPYYKEWFKLRYLNIRLPHTKGKLIIYLFNVC